MEKLTEALDNQRTSPENLRAAGTRWAVHALCTYDGKLLGRSLAISEAITNFCNELERPSLEE